MWDMRSKACFLWSSVVLTRFRVPRCLLAHSYNARDEVFRNGQRENCFSRNHFLCPKQICRLAVCSPVGLRAIILYSICYALVKRMYGILSIPKGVESMEDFIDEYKKLRRDAGKSIKALSEASGVGYSMIEKWEYANAQPTVSNFNKVLGALGYELKICKRN